MERYLARLRPGLVLLMVTLLGLILTACNLGGGGGNGGGIY